MQSIEQAFVVRTKKRDELQKYLLDNEIQTLIHYPLPPHKQDAYSEEIHEQVLSLPISGVQNIKIIVKVVNDFN